MRNTVRRDGNAAVLLGAAATALFMAAGGGALAAPPDDHGLALAALHDIEVAQREVVSVEDSQATDPAAYRRADQRAINALAGMHDIAFVAQVGNPGDPDGALGRIQHLLDRAGSPPWVAALRGVEANLRAAVARLQDARGARELMDHEVAVSAALENMLAALGRASEPGVFGGMHGALATTELGVPPDARQVDACAAPGPGPAFGTHQGYLAFVSLPLHQGTYRLPVVLGTTEVRQQGDVLVLQTAAAPRVAELCHARQSGRAMRDPAVRLVDDAARGFNQPSGGAAQNATMTPEGRTAAAAQPSNDGSAAQAGSDAWAGFNKPPQQAAARGPGRAGGNLPALYTKAQAQQGKQVYDSQCVSCHGPNLQGTAAPGVAGHEFLQTADRNDWSLEVIRTLVFQNMPFNAPDSLSPEQYARVMAFLLAANCFPAGNTPFPTEDKPEFEQIQLAPQSKAPPGANQFGVCPVD